MAESASCSRLFGRARKRLWRLLAIHRPEAEIRSTRNVRFSMI